MLRKIVKMFEPQYRVILLGLLLTVVLTSGEITNRGWWNHTVFYQIYPRSFMDSDNDGVGDLQGKTKQKKTKIYQAFKTHCVILYIFLCYIYIRALST